MHRNLFSLGRIAALIALGAPTILAQGVQTGTVSGTVRSSDGKALAGATVILATGQGSRTAVTDSQGSFRFGLLVPQASAKLTVSAKDFISVSGNVRINVDTNNVIDFNLKPIQAATATVEVVATASKVDITEAKAGQNVSLEDVYQLPINNRNIVALASLAPGTSSDANGLTIRGSQATQVQFLVDGADVQDPVTGGPAVRLNEDMLEEVQVISGAIPAEYGRFTGGVVNTVTKSGTNQFKGSVRFDVTNLKWNAYNPLDRGRDGKNTFPNAHTTTQTYTFSGPIIKDHLFFVVGYRTSSPAISTPGTTSSGDWGGVPFITTRTEERKDFKLDWQINNQHKVFWQYNKTLVQSLNRDYPTIFGLGSTSIETLSSQADLFQYVTFGYQGQLANSLFLDVRLNHKKETLGSSAGKSGGQGPKNAPLWFDLYTGDIFDNGFFANDGDSRPVRTANASLSWFFDAAGSHEFKTGVQLFESSRNSANAQTPSNYIIYFAGFKPGSTTPAVGNRVLNIDDPNSSWLEWWEPITGATTKNRSDAFFVQDKWTINTHWSLNYGFRYDKFNSRDDLGRDNFSFNEFSPRLSALYDLTGDRTKVWSMNYGVYMGNVIQGSTDAASPAGNPVQRDYVYLGGNPLLADGSVNRAAFAATPFYEDDPFLKRNTKVDPGLRAPRMQEWQVQYRSSDSKGTIWSLGISKRKWDRMVDDFKVLDTASGDLKTTIKNDNGIERDYFSIEGTYRTTVNNWNYGFNVTYSSLRGNYEGGQVGTTEQRNNYGPDGPSVDRISPTGFLQADRPLYVVADATYWNNLGTGKWFAGLLGTFTSGAPYSLIGGNAPTGLPQPYGPTYNRYYGDRGSLRFADTYRVDLSLGWEQPVFKTVLYFAKLTITNVFNHQVLATWNTTGNAPAGTWTPGSNFGRPTSAGNYINGRQLTLAGGLRF